MHTQHRDVPALGKDEQISAMDMEIRMVKNEQMIQPQIMVAGPPTLIPIPYIVLMDGITETAMQARVFESMQN